MKPPDTTTTFRGVVFDLDGTLVDSLDDVTAALSAAFESADLPPVTTEQVAPAMGHGSLDLVRAVMGAVVPGGSLDETLIGEIHARYYQRYAARPAALTTVFGGGTAALPALRQRGIRVGVCTNKSTGLAVEVLHAVGLDGAVEVVLGRDSVAHPKPDHRHLLEVMDRLDLTPHETVYVGDNPVDVAVAQSAGVHYRHVAWGVPVDPPVTRLDRFSDLIPVPDTGASSSGAPVTIPSKEH